MYCSSCGFQLSDGSAFCSSCGKSIAQNMPDTHNQAEEDGRQEVVLIESVCNRVKNAMNVQNGKAALTNERFIYFKHNAAKVMALGLLVNLTRGDIDIEIPLSDIDRLEDGRQGVSKTIHIYTKSGEHYHFYFTKREEWRAALEQAIQQRL